MDPHAATCPCTCHGRGAYAECDPAYLAEGGCGSLHQQQTRSDRRRAPEGCCPVCSRQVADSALCVTCTARFAGDLGAVPLLATQLDVIAAKLDQIGERGPRGGSEVPLGFRPMASEVTDVLHVTLTVWARYTATAAGVPVVTVPDDHPITAAAWLYGWREYIRHLPAVAQLVDEIGYAVTVARRAIDRPPDRQYAGPCDDCKPNVDLYARVGAKIVECRECGKSYPLDARRTWLLQGLREHLATAGEIAAGIGDLYGQPINRRTISMWFNRDRIQSHGVTREGWPLFKIGDVLDLAEQGATRRKVG